MPPIGPEGAPKSSLLRSRIIAQGAAVAATSMIGDVPEDATVTGVSLEPDAAIVGNTAATRTLNVVNRGQDGTGAAVVATLALITGTNPAAGDEFAFALSGTPANLSVAAGDVLAVQETVAGAGLANPGGSIKVTLTRR